MSGYVKVSRHWAAVAAIAVLAGCQTAPKSPEQPRTAPPTATRKTAPPEKPREAAPPPLDQAAQGRLAFAELKRKERISDDPIYTAQVQRVSKRLARPLGVDFPGVKWEFVIFDAPRTIGAFALPGGEVSIDSGLLKVVETDAELAYLLGHVIAHVTAKHGTQRMNEGGFMMAASVRAGESHRAQLLASYGVATEGAAAAGFSRAQESEADFIGLHYAAKAGYDPRAAINFWRKIGALGGMGSPPEFLRIHPPNETRVTNLEKWLPEVRPLYEAARVRYE